MPFTDPCMAWQSLLSEHFSSEDAMADIRFRAKAFYARCIRLDNTDVVEHCSLFDELSVEVQLRM